MYEQVYEPVAGNLNASTLSRSSVFQVGSPTVSLASPKYGALSFT